MLPIVSGVRCLSWKELESCPLGKWDPCLGIWVGLLEDSFSQIVLPASLLIIYLALGCLYGGQRIEKL